MTNDRQIEIIRELNDNRSKLSALYSLYNSALLGAEEERAELSSYYEQMIDFKNDVSLISNMIFAAKKSERSKTATQNKSKIKKLNTDAKSVNSNFKNVCSKYKLALQDCGSLKTEYKHNVSELCKEFKAICEPDENTYKGYKQQVKMIKAILEKIELLISNYNVNKNKIEKDSENFNQIYESVNSMIEQLQSIA